MPSLAPEPELGRPVIQGRVVGAILDAAAIGPALRAQLLDAQGLRGTDLRGLDASVPLASYMRLFDALAKTLGQPALGLDLSLRMGPEMIGALGYAFLHSATLDAAFAAFARAVFSIQGVTMLRYDREPQPVVRYVISDDRLHPRRQDVEFSLGYVHALIRRFTGHDRALREVHFQHPRVGPRAHYEAVFGCPVYFDQPGNALVLDADIMTVPGRLHDPHLVSILQDAIDRARPFAAGDDALTPVVERLLPDMIEAGNASCRLVAKRLGLSEETLRRRLRQEGHSFRTLLRQRRCAMASRYLHETGLSILEIAQRTGYAETAAFTRAYAAQTGMTPSQARQIGSRIDRAGNS